MEQNHPIPQQISSYQFRLVGDMTLKQFFQVAGGALVGLLFYASPLHPLIKWPLIIFFCLLGAALAFLPFEERPLEKWIIAFFRSVYSPTIFSWKQNQTSKYFQDESIQTPAHNFISPGGEAALNTYLASSETPNTFFSKLETSEKSFLNKMGDLFTFTSGSPNKGSVQLNQQGSTTIATQQTQPVQSSTQTPVPNFVVPQSTPTVQIPQTPPVKVEPTNTPRFIVEESTPDAAQQIKEETISPTNPVKPEGERIQAIFSPDAAPPSPPTIPNTVSGQVMDSNGKIVTGAILEIRDISGRPVRALRSNMLGHFLIVTPLVNGTYEIVTEKDGLTFDVTKFDVSGGILDPIAIRAKASAPVVSPASSQFVNSQALQI